MTKLSENFSLSEFLKSQTAERRGIDNTPNQGQVESLRVLTQNVLQPARDHFGPIIVTSGYRSPELNEAIGGSETSQHRFGEAADIESPHASNVELAEWIRDNMSFDQLILEGYHKGSPSSGWVHVSYVNDSENRNEVLTATFTDSGVHYSYGLNV